jgi:hypothetical protein
MRSELINPKPKSSQKTTSAREQYMKMLREAGQFVDCDEFPLAGCSDIGEGLVFPDDQGFDLDRRAADRDYELGTSHKIACLEENVRILMATGNYEETDPIIRSLRSQIREIKNL